MIFEDEYPCWKLLSCVSNIDEIILHVVLLESISEFPIGKCSYTDTHILGMKQDLGPKKPHLFCFQLFSDRKYAILSILLIERSLYCLESFKYP